MIWYIIFADIQPHTRHISGGLTIKLALHFYEDEICINKTIYDDKGSLYSIIEW